jgi:hypothetical protein
MGYSPDNVVNLNIGPQYYTTISGTQNNINRIAK